MMEEVQTIFAVGAGAVTKLVDHNATDSKNPILRISNPKYPYEYLRRYNEDGGERAHSDLKAKCLEFFGVEQ